MDAALPRCNPGASVTCACANGMTGAQVCAANGTFGICVCGQAGGDGSSVDVAPARDTAPGAPIDAAVDGPTDAPPLAVDAPVSGVEAGDQPRPPVPDAGGAVDGGATANVLNPVPACGSFGTGGIGSVAVSPDGTLVALGELDGTVSAYHLPDGSLAFQSFPFPRIVGVSVAFSPDGAALLIHADDTDSGAVVVVSAKDGRTLVQLDGASGPAAFSPDGTLVAARLSNARRSDDAPAGLWDARTGARLRVTACVARYEADPEVIQFSGDGANVRYGSTVCSVASGMMVGNIGSRNGDITPDFKEGLTVGQIPGGKTLIPAVYAVRASDWVTLRSLGSYEFNSGFRLSPDGTTFAAIAPPSVVLRRFSDGSEAGRVDVPAAPAGLAFSPGSRFLLSWYQDKSVRVHDIATRDVTNLVTRPGHTADISRLAYSRDGALLVSGGGGDGTVRLWRTSDGALLWTKPENASSVEISGDGALIGITGVVGQTTRLLRATDGVPLLQISGPMLSFSPDGTLVATAIPFAPGNTTARQFGVKLWKTTDGTLVRDLMADATVNSRPPSRGSFSFDGRLFAIDNNDPVSYRGVKLWRVADGSELPGFENMNAAFIAFADSESVITGSQSDAAFVMSRWRIQDGTPLWKVTYPGTIRTPLSYPARYGSFQVGRDAGNLAFFEAVTGRATIVRTSDGIPIHIFPAYASALALAPSGKFLATSGTLFRGFEQSIRIWCVP
jgi:WD40 repeat protein